MATNYPDDYDGFVNPNSFTSQSQVSHSEQHSNANDAIEAIQHALGLLPQGSSSTVADRLGDMADVTDLPTGLTELVAGDELLAIQDGGLVLRDADDVLDRANHTGTMPYSALGAAPILKLRSSVNQSIINGGYAPLTFDTADLNQGGLYTFDTSSTTVASGSNGVGLPTGTINVASTAGFASAGSLAINGPPGSGIVARVDYLGKTSTTFTSCTGGSGTLATSQVVKASNDTITLTQNGIYLLIGTIGFNAHATGQRGARFTIAGVLATGETLVPTTNTVQVLTTSTIAYITTSTTLSFGGYQNSGGVLTSAADLFNAPTFTIVRLGA